LRSDAGEEFNALADENPSNSAELCETCKSCILHLLERDEPKNSTSICDMHETLGSFIDSVKMGCYMCTIVYGSVPSAVMERLLNFEPQPLSFGFERLSFAKMLCKKFSLGKGIYRTTVTISLKWGKYLPPESFRDTEFKFSLFPVRSEY
jgi:hypothetical protein